MENKPQTPIKVAILLEHHDGDASWTARVPLIDGCMAEGKSPEEAKAAIVPEIAYFTHHTPGLIDTLRKPPTFQLSEVIYPTELPQADQSSSQNQSFTQNE